MRPVTVTAALTAQNTFSDSLRASDRSFSISVAGINGHTVTLQRKEVGGSTWKDVEAYTANTEKNIDSLGRWDWRLGVKTGDFGTGTVALILNMGVSGRL